MNLTDAQMLARTALDAHGLTDKGWRVEWDNAKRRNGSASSSARVITLSAPLTHLKTPEEMRQTIGHEIAHALVGTQHGHGPVWKAKMRELGLVVSTTAVLSEETRGQIATLRNYTLTCVVNGKSLGHLDRIVKQRKVRRGGGYVIRTYGARVCKCHGKPVLYNGKSWDDI